MNRRAFIGSAAFVPLAGCTGSLPGFGDDSTVLSAPDQSRGDVSHPTHGDSFPNFSVPDPLRDEVVDRDQLVAEGPFVMTFIYTSCQDRCGELMGILNLIQHDAKEEGWDDDVGLIAMTWDPETDDTETLRTYGEQHGLDLEHERFRFLRPESAGEAIDLVDGTFGVPAHHGADHEHHQDDEHSPAHATHYYMIFIVNANGVVERSYPGPVLFDHTPNDIIEHVRTVVT